ncbi:sporulation transcriptional regulator SpoIIID [Natranaerobius thermophilus]|uniref:Transcriptional regulator n=1 Tax=Natranaerobius thermophilus (strain ATCC BAA-1301 / DSM 18059 / JW/NM-WN-LF) TaxID=457570 RepID=B2A3F4_NATTJ|nr:sporulation transcriptional regulator SpoIIID [Natranaerobius thermophilus]ACB86383.1 transcriptional regulator [Natranaerobius thermophilus JW/NM-WN-LF]
MQDYIQERVLEISQYILDTKATVRQVAKNFGVSKSTVHKDITERLPLIKPDRAKDIKKILNQNKAERHIRGGEATRKKYSQPHEIDESEIDQEKELIKENSSISN